MWYGPAILWLALVAQNDIVQRGLEALEAHKYQEAAESFAQAVQKDPDDFAALFHLALAHSLLGKDEQAIAEYQRVLELKPGLYEAQLNLGILLLRQKRPQQALPFLQAAAAARPEQARAQTHLGLALLEIGQLADAEKALAVAVRLDPGSPLAHLGLARALARQSRLDEAEPHFRKAAALDPGFQDALWELAALYEQAGRKAEAIAIYRQFPEELGARERLGQLLLESGQAAEAVPHLEWAVRRSPTVANRAALALAYARSGDAAKAIEQLGQTLKENPQEVELRLMLGRLLRDQKRYAEAAGEFLRYVEARPDSVEGWNELAAMLISLEQYSQALEALERIRALGGEGPGHHYLRAIVLDKIRDLKGALASYQAFLASSQGKYPDEEFKARQRVRVIEKELRRR